LLARRATESIKIQSVRHGTLVTLCSSPFSVLILAAAVGLPKFIVPNLPDLAIKTRRASGDWLSQLDTLYLKGARPKLFWRPSFRPVSFGTRSSFLR
jgi:hypothetical protein